MLQIRKSPLVPVFVTVFIDMIGVGIVIPVLSPLFVGAGSPFAGADWSYALRTIFIGLLVACYPFAQFFGAPYLGALSDRFGRKPILVLSLIGTFIGYIFFALAIKWRLLWLLFASRLLDGFTGGNISTAQSAIADLSDSKEKSRNFSLTGIAFALGFIIGPYLGGKLADPNLVHWFTSSTPFWFAAILTFFNIVLVWLRFDETLKVPLRASMTIFAGVRNIKRAFGLINVRMMFLISFFFIASYNFYIQFFPVLLIRKFGYTESAIGNLYGYIGVWVAITHVFVTIYVNRRWRPAQILPWSLLFMGLTLAGVMIPQVTWLIYVMAPFMALTIAASNPNITTVISNMADEKSQGEILGITQSINALAMTIPPIIAGLIVSAYVYLPLMMGALAALLAWWLFVYRLKVRRVVPIYHEV